MSRLIAAEFRKLLSTRMWLLILVISVAWTVFYTALTVALSSSRAGRLGPPLSTAAGQHALVAIAAGGAGTLVAVMAMASVAGEYRHRTAVTTFLAVPHRSRVLLAQVITFALAGVSYTLACVVLELAVTVPWLAARGIHVSPFGDGSFVVLLALVVAGALFGVAGAGLGAIMRSQLAAVTALLLYLYLLEPLLDHIRALRGWTPYLPGVAADGLTSAVQDGVRLLSPWAGGLVFTAWAIVFAITGIIRTSRMDVT